HAVDLDGFGKRLLEGVRHTVGDTLAPCHGPDRERAIVTEASITPAFSDQEQGSGMLEQKRTLRGLLVGLRAGVGSGDEPDRCTGQLAADRTLHVLIHRTMQLYHRKSH